MYHLCYAVVEFDPELEVASLSVVVSRQSASWHSDQHVMDHSSEDASVPRSDDLHLFDAI